MKAKERTRIGIQALKEHFMLNSCEFCRILNNQPIDAVRYCCPEIQTDMGADRWTKTHLPYPNCPNCKVSWRKAHYTFKTLPGVRYIRRRFADKHRNASGHRDLMTKAVLKSKQPTLQEILK